MRFWMTTLAALVLCGTGCDSTQKTASLDEVNADYDAARYADAQSKAETLAAHAEGTEQQQARYLAGLSAIKRYDYEAAEKALNGAIGGPDREIAGHAAVALGSLCVTRDQFHQAASLFDQAAVRLEGEAAQQAREHAALARRSAGIGSSDRSYTSHASSSPSEAYTLQVGAFADQYRAKRAAAAVSQIARRHQHGSVRIVRSWGPSGDPVHLVQFGAFDSRHEAEAARRRLPSLDCYVTESASAMP